MQKREPKEDTEIMFQVSNKPQKTILNQSRLYFHSQYI